MTTASKVSAEDAAKAIQAALDAGPTDGGWAVLEHSWSDTSIVSPGFDHGICRLDINHATEESQSADEKQMAANANYIAACNPAAMCALLAERAALQAKVQEQALTIISLAAQQDKQP